tara:strand:- start:10847 stop:12571 length:1725 start_codon:yes stop_codon:yes gene_type:complete
MLIIAKFSIVVLAFSYQPQTANFNISLMELFASLMIGCTVGYVTNLFHLLITQRHHHSRASNISESIIKWIKICQNTRNKQQMIPKPTITSINEQHLKLVETEELYTAISILFYKYQKIICSESIGKSLEIVSKNYFKQILKNKKTVTSELVRKACDKFTDEVTHTINLRNNDEVELCYIIQRLSDDLIHFSNLSINHHTLKRNHTDEKSLNKIKYMFSDHSLLTKGKLSVNSKIAIRAMIAIPLALVLSKIVESQHPSWVILTTNLILQVRFGDTIKKAMERTLGHIAGFIITLILANYIWPQFSTPFFWIPILIFMCTYNINKNYFFFSLSIMLTIIFYDYISHRGYYDLFSIIFSTAKSRLIDTLLGAGIALSTSLLLFPSTGNEALKNMHQNIIDCFIKLLTMINQHYDEYQLTHLKNEMVKIIESNKAVYLSFQHQPQNYMRKDKVFYRRIKREKEILQCFNSLIFRLQSPFDTKDLIDIGGTEFKRHINELERIISNNQSSIIVKSSIKILWPEKFHKECSLLVKAIGHDSQQRIQDRHNQFQHYQPNLEMIGLNNTLLDMIDALQLC